jgi:hypothetical protein
MLEDELLPQLYHAIEKEKENTLPILKKGNQTEGNDQIRGGFNLPKLQPRKKTMNLTFDP